eukprot:scaffold221403_cov31-Tisochrysis_lutea.AAC.3
MTNEGADLVFVLALLEINLTTHMCPIFGIHLLSGRFGSRSSIDYGLSIRAPAADAPPAAPRAPDACT